MGASVWQYWVPYEKDITSALERLRDRVFADGDYYKGHGEWKLDDPSSIEDVFHQLDEMGSTDGTHSILDVGSVADEPDYGVVAPLSEAELVELFGTAKPSRAQVEAEQQRLASLRSRWEGTYVVAYVKGRPKEILFIGTSGD